MRRFRIAMVQMNPTVGDLPGNVRRIAGWLREARKAQADLVAFPELAITGYPPEDLLLKPKFLSDTYRALREVMKHCRGVAAVVGFVGDGAMAGTRSARPLAVPTGAQDISNAAAVIAGQRLVATYSKQHLPNYGVFDERRYFHPGRRIPVIVLSGTTVGVNICEDIWVPEGPTRAQAMAGAEIVVNINASPFHVGKTKLREQMLATRARENGVIVTYTNTVGGQDELIFDGNSLILDQAGDVILRGKAFEEDFLVADLDVGGVARARMGAGRRKWAGGRTMTHVDLIVVSSTVPRKPRELVLPTEPVPLDPLEEVYQALVLGVRDYVRKNGFGQVVIGLSGGVDSA
ncbi:MAG: NAD+ synthase, partial [Nitrospirota bacterium]|nr:NAD+ synthase [Nitrospirota bacterium]